CYHDVSSRRTCVSLDLIRRNDWTRYQSVSRGPMNSGMIPNRVAPYVRENTATLLRRKSRRVHGLTSSNGSTTLAKRGAFEATIKKHFGSSQSSNESLRRKFTHGADDIKVTSKRRLNPAQYEKELLLEFQQGAHQSSGFVPLFNEVLDWLALMQHYGAPTRLLDWTRSPYV